MAAQHPSYGARIYRSRESFGDGDAMSDCVADAMSDCMADEMSDCMADVMIVYTAD